MLTIRKFPHVFKPFLSQQTQLNTFRCALRLIYWKNSRLSSRSGPVDLLADMNRGLLLVTKTNAAGKLCTRLQIDDQWEHRMRDNYYGNGHLFNGEHFHRRIHLSRDGGHGPLDAGIAGSIHDRAKSIVMGSNDKHADVDMDDRIYYWGIALPKLDIPDDPEPVAANIKDTAASRNRANREETHGTGCLRKSKAAQVPVRVFRSGQAEQPCSSQAYQGIPI